MTVAIHTAMPMTARASARRPMTAADRTSPPGTVVASARRPLGASVSGGSAEGVTYARLRVSDPARWWAAALAWRRWAAMAGPLSGRLTQDIARVACAWSGVAAAAAIAALTGLCKRLVLFRVLCWRADQAVGEFADALTRARRLLARAEAAARRAGAAISDDGVVTAPSPAGARADLAAALALAEEADEAAAGRLTGIARDQDQSPDGVTPIWKPACTASPAAVSVWWSGLDPGARLWLLATEPSWLGSLDGIPAADRDAANRLLLDGLRAARPSEALDTVAARLADSEPRAYLLRLDPAGDGRIVLALGDPDRAGGVLTHVPGMTAGLGSYRKELARAERVAGRAAEISPAVAMSAVLWLDYDAPDAVGEAASARQATAGAPILRRFQEGLRATQLLPAARHTVVGHSYGSLLVGEAAATPGLAADGVVFVGSPGVGAGSVRDLAVPADRVWASTSRGDAIQYAAVAPGGLLRTALEVPLAGPAHFLGAPARELWFGHNPNDPAFGARHFPSAATAGHVGYWEPGSPSLNALAAIALGVAP